MDNDRYRILLIEDDKVDQMAFKQLVKKENLPYDCTVANSVSDARNILSNEQFDVIIADYLIGDGTAIDILAEVKNTPVILVTGAGDEEVAVKSWKNGAYDYLIKDADQNYLKAVSITIENAIKYKRTEEKLQLLSHAVMSTDDSICITDMSDKVLFVNRAFCETYGYEQDEIIGKESDVLWENNPSSAGTKSYQVVDGWEVAFYHKRKDGSEFPVSLTRSAIKNENGEEIAVISVARDISDRIQVEEQLRAENARLKKLLGASANT
jgi:PAS domain S-box-containing protein